MRTILGVLALSLTLAAGAFAGVAEGKADYAKRCQSCHGADGKANPAIAKAMKVEMKDLGAKDVQGLGDAKLTEVMQKGVGKMKPVAGLTDAQAKDILAFMHTLK